MAVTPEEQQAKVMALHRAKQMKGQVPLEEGKAKAILQGLGPDEPVFILRAQDILSVLVLSHYSKLIEEYTSNGDQLQQVVDLTNDFREWQRAHPGKVKLPD